MNHSINYPDIGIRIRRQREYAGMTCDELGYVKDYGNLHFHEPEVFLPEDLYICNKASGRYLFVPSSI